MSPLRERLYQRAVFLDTIRRFFAARGVIEADTAQLRACGVTDPQLVPLAADGGYLQTSPDYASFAAKKKDANTDASLCCSNGTAAATTTCTSWTK